MQLLVGLDIGSDFSGERAVISRRRASIRVDVSAAPLLFFQCQPAVVIRDHRRPERDGKKGHEHKQE